MEVFFLVAFGGVLGAVSRYSLSTFIKTKHKKSFPFETFIINITGSFLLGLIIGDTDIKPEIYLFFGVGFMGAYTTFSTFQFEAVELIRKNKLKISLTYLISSVMVGLLFCLFGFTLGKYI